MGLLPLYLGAGGGMGGASKTPRLSPGVGRVEPKTPRLTVPTHRLTGKKA
mgnify:CR=1 FL=1